MNKNRIYLTFLFRLGLEILALEVAFLAVAWLLHQYWYYFQRFRFADELFILGALLAVMGSAGMMRSPYWMSLSPFGVWANPIQSTEEEKEVQLKEELLHQVSFGMRLLAIGVISLLLSIAMTYLI